MSLLSEDIYILLLQSNNKTSIPVIVLSSDLSANLKGGLEEKYQQVSMYLRCAKEFQLIVFITSNTNI